MFVHGRVRVAALAVTDAVCVAFAWSTSVLAYWFIGGRYSPDLYLGFWPVVLAFIFLNTAFGLYHGSPVYPAAPLSPVDEMRKLFLSAAITHLGVIAVLIMLFQTTRGYSRAVILIACVLTAILAQPVRNVARRILFRLRIGQIPVVMAGGGAIAHRVASVLAADAYTGFKLLGYFGGALEERMDTAIAACPCLGSFDDVVRESMRRNVKILLACQDERLFMGRMNDFSHWFTYIEFFPAVDALPVFGSKSLTIGGAGGLEMVNQTRMKMKRVQKRMMDTLLAFCAFMLLLPLFAVIPVLIKLTSRGPVFFRQRRLGLHGKNISVWKFRSMFEDAEGRLSEMLKENPEAADEWKRNFKLVADPRITPLGRWLRKTSLDELPQLFNVLSGEMALIGPRPIVEEEISHYGESYSVISSVKPGITGLWQVSGRSDIGYSRRVALDTCYVLNWSIWMDVWILIRTVHAVVFMRGAR